MNFANFKSSGNPDQKNNIRFFIFMVKNLEICILFFRVPKKCMSGLPYLRNSAKKNCNFLSETLAK